MSGEAALVALVPEDQQMNDTISVIPHTACQVAYCKKPLQPTTSEEDVDMLTRRERESAPSHEPNADPNPYTTELLSLKQEGTQTERREMQDPELEEVLNKELTGLTVEDWIVELRLTLEDERELREREISDLMCFIGELQRDHRESHGEVAELTTQLMAPPPPSPPSPPPPPPPLSESFFTLPMGEIHHMIAGTAEEAAETLARAEKAKSFRESSLPPPFPFTVIPDSTESSPAQSPTPFPSPSGAEKFTGIPDRTESPPAQPPTPFPFPSYQPTAPITTPIGGNRVESTIEISEKPCRDSYVEGNSPICNLGASGSPPSIESIKPDTKLKDPDTHMTNNTVQCQPGLPASQHASAAPEKSPRKPQTEDEIKAEIRQHEAGIEAMIQKTEANPLLDKDDNERKRRQTTPPHTRNRAQDTVEAEVTSQRKTSKPAKKPTRRPEDQLEDRPAPESGTIKETTEIPGTKRRGTEEVIRDIGAFRGFNGNKGAFNSDNRRPSRQAAPGTDSNGKTPPPTHPGTGANATLIGPSQETTPPKEPTPLAHGKPGRIQRTRPGEGYWEQGPKNTADIESTSRPMSVQVLMTGWSTIPARGDSWKRSFLAGFNAKRERLAPETPICATQVSFAFSYPSERVVTIYHPANIKYEEIIRAVARVRREMYNNYIQHLNESLVSILQETTELVAPGLQGTRGEKAWDRAESICRDLKLTKAARPPKWLVKGKGDGYEGKKCSLRFSVTTASLRAIKSPLPIVYNKNKIYLYQRLGDKAFYVDKLKYMAFEPRPSHSPEPVQTWGACTYCHKLNHTEDTYWSKKNAQLWREQNEARNKPGKATQEPKSNIRENATRKPTSTNKPKGNTRDKPAPANE
ncbi:hypothetical protein L211DRAFT_852439 [Terfezia boudieri ATCC MYA-4762]|uniref:Uncharacterized protein n=1 Tax=Terfezia boudieri ATCC MYA-4762 TaxID=1051890 RepID=A0A3N4LFT2_9PEZI|nr:hypothetical protein L211DRAFT_852439 [Terfezia boudieri ATCC MYA-4762]